MVVVMAAFRTSSSKLSFFGFVALVHLLANSVCDSAHFHSSLKRPCHSSPVLTDYWCTELCAWTFSACSAAKCQCDPLTCTSKCGSVSDSFCQLGCNQFPPNCPSHICSCTISATPTPVPLAERDVCVIGAGPSGLSAALFLQDRGYSVAVFEKNNRVGGKAYSPFVGTSGQRQDIGATILTDAYTSVFELLARFDMLDELMAEPHNTKFVDSNGDPPLVATFASMPAAIADAVSRYVALIQQEPFLSLYTRQGFGHLDFSNPILRMPTLAWLGANNLQALIPAFTIYGTLFGYGSLTSVPIMYMVKYLNPTNLLAALSQGPLYNLDRGFQSFAEAIANHLSEPVHLGVSVTVDRCKGGHSAGGTGKRHILKISGVPKFACAHIIVAFPPTASAIQNLFPTSYTELEDQVFSRVMTEPYASALASWNLSPSSPLYVPASTKWEVVFPNANCDGASDGSSCTFMIPGYTAPLEGLDVAFTMTYGQGWAMDGMIAKDSADPFAAFTTIVSRLNNYGTVTVDPSTFNLWAYFPHFAAADLHFHKIAEMQLQGTYNTWYTGGFWNFETVETAVAYSKQLVSERFALRSTN